MICHLDALPRHFSGKLQKKRDHEKIFDSALKRALQNICSNLEITETKWSNLCNLNIACPNNAENSKVKKTGRLHNLKIICSENCGTFKGWSPKQTTASSTNVFLEMTHITQLYNRHDPTSFPEYKLNSKSGLFLLSFYATVQFILKFQNLQNISQAASFSRYFKMISWTFNSKICQ